MAFVVPVGEELLISVNTNDDVIEKPKDTKFMIVDDEGYEIYENDFAGVWVFDGRFIFGKVVRISHISIEIINEQRVKTHIPYRIISRILKNF